MNQQQLFVKMALDAWNVQVDRTTKLFDSLSDAQLQQEVAPGRNSGVYLLGHLTAVHDGIFPLFGLKERTYPQLEEVFVKNPDKSGIEKTETQRLREYWKDVNQTLLRHFNQLSVDEWFQKHAAVSDDDFEKEPYRNKLNVILNRTNHLANHLGQLIFLKQ